MNNFKLNYCNPIPDGNFHAVIRLTHTKTLHAPLILTRKALHGPLDSISENQICVCVCVGRGVLGGGVSKVVRNLT